MGNRIQNRMGKLASIDITSDIHISHWLPINKAPKKLEKHSHVLINKLLPDNPSDVLVIAGDLDNHNFVGSIFIKVLKEYYQHIIWVHGNHDFYFESKSIARHYNINSFNRLNEKIELLNEIGNVHYLDGNTIKIDGVTFGGCSMWYNNDYAKQVWSIDNDLQCLNMWFDYLNDGNAISLPKGHEFEMIGTIDYLAYFRHQYEKLKKIYLKCNVIITHIAPDWKLIKEKFKMPETTFYHFDGSELLNNLDETKMWIFGHSHSKSCYSHKSGCTLIANPLGYPSEHGMSSYTWSEKRYNPIIEKLKFITMPVGKIPNYEDLFINSEYEQKNDSIQKRAEDGDRV